MKKSDQKTDKPRRKRKGLRLLLGIVLAVVVLWTVAMAVSSSSVSSDRIYTGSNYDTPVTQTLSNGDIVYTPSGEHVVQDADSTILYYNNLLLVFTDRDLDEAERTALAQTVDGEVVGVVSGAIHALQIQVPNSTLAQLEDLADTLMAQEQVMYASSEYPVQVMGTSSDSNPWDAEVIIDDRGNEAYPDGNDWWAEAIGAYTAWNYTDQCQPIKVGIADSGVYAEHEDLAGQVISINRVSNDWMDDHGTHVAGIIGALNNDLGIRGIADFAQLYSYDLWPEEDPNSYHTMAEYLAAINFMAENGVKVVNNSWGCIILSEDAYMNQKYGNMAFIRLLFAGDEYQGYMEQRLNDDLAMTAEASIAMMGQLIDSGYEDFIIVQAAGNGYDNGGDGVDARYGGFFCSITPQLYQSMNHVLLDALTARGITYEHIDKRILIVGAVENTTNADGDYLMTSFSNFGDTVDICAPGGDIYSTVLPDSGLYMSNSGTSMAAPMVTGSLAFIWALEPELSAPEVRQILLDNTSVQAFISTNDFEYTYPMLNVGLAVQAVLAN